MEWHVTMLAVHVVGAILCTLMYRHAPCWMQKLVVVGLVAGMFLIAIAYAVAIGGFELWWHVALLGLVIEHVAIMLYVFRVLYKSGVLLGAGDNGAATGRTASAR